MALSQRFTITAKIHSISETIINYEVNDAPQLYQYWHDVIATQPDFEPEKETVIVVLMNTKFIPFAWHRVSLGTLSEAPAQPREVIRPVIVGSAYAYSIMHNHPSGDPTPSHADTRFTRRMFECSELLQIRLLDHVIIGKPSPGNQPYFSYREAGMI